MTSVKNQTARVHWKMGQSLLPEHFYAQEESLREELALKMAFSPYPAWGLGSLKWDGFQLLKGVVAIQEATIILPSGTVIDIPGNTQPASFNLNVTGASSASVYVHLLSEYETSGGLEAGAGDEDNVERVEQKIALSEEAVLKSGSALQSFKLAEFDKSAEGVWSLSSSFLPAMLRVSGHPLFDATMERIRGLVTTYHQTLVEYIQENYLAGESLLAGKQALRGLYGLRTFLANSGRGVHHHPYAVFEALSSFYLDVCVFQGVAPNDAVLVYDHGELGRSFTQLLQQLQERVGSTHSAAAYVPFVRKEGLQVCRLPDEAKKADHVYLLVQKPRVGDVLNLTGLKVASEGRIAVVHQLALTGIPIRKIERPPFSHPFSSEVEFYLLAEGEEWDHAVKEGRIAFFHRNDLEHVRPFIYWRND